VAPTSPVKPVGQSWKDAPSSWKTVKVSLH
jgi:hypothetical protein